MEAKIEQIDKKCGFHCYKTGLGQITFRIKSPLNGKENAEFIFECHGTRERERERERDVDVKSDSEIMGVKKRRENLC